MVTVPPLSRIRLRCNALRRNGTILRRNGAVLELPERTPIRYGGGTPVALP